MRDIILHLGIKRALWEGSWFIYGQTESERPRRPLNRKSDLK